MSEKPKKNSAFQPKRIRRSIKLDRFAPKDFLSLNMTYACEQCSFYNPDAVECMMGFPCEPHLQANQLRKFESHSHMAFCRFLEID